MIEQCCHNFQFLVDYEGVRPESWSGVDIHPSVSVSMMAKKYNLRSAKQLVNTLAESQTAKGSAVDYPSDEDDGLEEITGSESEEDAETEEFKPPEEIESEESDSEGAVPAKRQRPERSIDRVVVGENGHKWYTTPRERSRERRNSLKTYLPTPIGAARQVSAPIEAWNLLFPDSLLKKVLRHTNEEIKNNVEALEIDDTANPTYSEISLIELKAYIGLLYFSGMQKTNHTSVEDLWSHDYGSIVYRSTMSRHRFSWISKNLRFDNKTTRRERKENDKFASIREIWDQFLANCTKYYSPSSYCTIDEQIVPFRGRCPFKVYNAAKPDKYGIKIVMLNDARTFYMFSALPYVGKIQTEKNESIPSYYITKLSEQLHQTNRNITCDNSFSSIPIFEKMLTEYSITMVGTLRKNKREIPDNFRRAGEVSSSKFAFDGNMTLVTHTPKRNKIVILLSTLHHTSTIDTTTNKPEIIDFYNTTKGGTDTFDQLCHEYSTHRETLRWPIRIWMAMLDQGGINALILHNFNADLESMRRRQFLRNLVHSLVEPHLRTRLKVPSLRRDLRNNIMILLDEKFQPAHQPPKKPARCGLCPRSEDRKTRIYCSKCKRPTCENHRIINCSDCGAFQ